MDFSFSKHERAILKASKYSSACSLVYGFVGAALRDGLVNGPDRAEGWPVALVETVTLVKTVGRWEGVVDGGGDGCVTRQSCVLARDNSKRVKGDIMGFCIAGQHCVRPYDNCMGVGGGVVENPVSSRVI